jgi:hypothetical protein
MTFAGAPRLVARIWPYAWVRGPVKRGAARVCDRSRRPGGPTLGPSAT